jgi:hypothetical protein
MDIEAWSAGAPCDEDAIVFCGRCRPRAFPARVFITGGGSAFHATNACSLLVSGQERVAQKSRLVSPVESAALQVALGRGYFPCQGCFPEAGGRP